MCMWVCVCGCVYVGVCMWVCVCGCVYVGVCMWVLFVFGRRVLDVGVGGVGEMMCVYVGGGVVSNGFIS